MDKISVIGLLLGLIAITLGQWLEGGHIGSLLQFTAFLIVIGGTAGAVMLQSRVVDFVAGMRMVKWVFVPPAHDFRRILNTLTTWSQQARRAGLLGLEQFAMSEKDPFVKRGLQMLVDGAEPETIRHAMELDIDAWELHARAAAKIWEAAGGYAPTIGILGAVLGLIHVMENLSDPSRLGAGIAVAFVATIYGVGSANLIFLPIANKLKFHIGTEVRRREMLTEGLITIANGENPRMMESKLAAYL
ncbi:flagellar motor protein [Silvimonas iriomotensis]|uniref:Flagellar motor protein n=1 Tax=Silvimonas iriomotensis TaxID=449662 RepID=A0ABQ2P8E6_9NEIS|nr:flagellar motor protein [Silvimonas iriomotensis]GGP20921.1 flagellar motor protein [Silvimonas iriomotensis]